MEIQKIINKAVEAINSGHKKYATSLLKYITRKDPDNIQARKLLYATLMNTIDIPRANKIKSYFTKLKGEQFIKKGQIKLGIELLEQAFELNPMNIHILISIAEILANRNSQAIELLESIEIEHIQDPNMLKKIARVYLNAKNYPLAKKALKRILIVTPNDLESQKMLKNLEALGVLQKEFKAS